MTDARYALNNRNAGTLSKSGKSPLILNRST